jgi:hypothetical protein
MPELAQDEIYCNSVSNEQTATTSQQSQTQTVAEEAHWALAQGYQPIPMMRGSKAPSHAGWPDLLITLETFDVHFNGHPQNVAILNGTPSGGLIDIDLDSDGARRMASEFLPRTGMAFGRETKPWSHWLYRCTPLPQTAKFQDVSARVIVEIRSTGTATMWPGSEHPSGELVTWHARGEPATIAGPELQRAVARLAAASLLVQHYPAPGGRDELKLPLIAVLLRLGLTDVETRHFILTVANAASDEEAIDRVAGIGRTRQRLLNGEPVAGWKKLGEILGNKPVVKRIRSWLDPAPYDTTPQQRQQVDDFLAYLPERKYVFLLTGALWPAKSVRESVEPVPIGLDDDGEQITQLADLWLDTHRSVQQMTWAPGLPQVIEGRVLHEGGWVERPDLCTFNLYRPPSLPSGDPTLAGPWVEHVQRLYPEDHEHITAWLCHRAQRPQEKINHALVLGGEQGIGKDTILAPVRQAVGPWNVANVSPSQVSGRFNGFIKSVLAQIDEARDLGEISRYAFYEHMKTYTAAPPDTLLCDEKFVNPYPVLNVCGVIYTTNYRADALYLPSGDRRHYVAWSELKPGNLPEGYFTRLYAWLEQEQGHEHVAAFLRTFDLSGFDPKAPPPKTRAFWTLVNANQTPEDAALADALDALGNPDAVTIRQIASVRDSSVSLFEQKTGGTSVHLESWLTDPRNARVIPHRMEAAAYVRVDNPNSQDGVWKVEGKRTVIYANKDLSHGEQTAAAHKLIETTKADKSRANRSSE